MSRSLTRFQPRAVALLSALALALAALVLAPTALAGAKCSPPQIPSRIGEWLGVAGGAWRAPACQEARGCAPGAARRVRTPPNAMEFAAGSTKEGWGRYPSFMGRYHVRVLDGGRLHVVGGELTMFPQEEFPGSIQPAGILKLKTKRGNNDLVYLTELRHAGRRGRLAEVHGGAFVGPKIGGFGGRLLAPGRLRAAVTTRGLGTVKALFVRYSKKPIP